MSFMKRLFYLSRQQQLPRLRHHLTSGRRLDTPDEDVNLLLGAGLMRDWTNARALVERTGKTPLELFWELSKKRRPDWRRRLNNVFIHMSGGYTFNPHAAELKAIEKERRK